MTGVARVAAVGGSACAVCADGADGGHGISSAGDLILWARAGGAPSHHPATFRLASHRVFFFRRDLASAAAAIVAAARVEAVVPIEDPAHGDQLDKLFDLYADDNASVWDMRPDGAFVQRQPEAEERRVQGTLMRRWRGGLRTDRG